MFIMSENLRTDYTYQLEKAKQSLDEFFCIPLKEEANDIVEKMKKRNTKINSSSLGELDEELVKILRNDKTYFSENRKVSSDGEIVAKSLFEKSYEDAKLEENKKPYEKRKTVSMYADIERNATTIAKYAEYVSNLKSIKELDKLFLEKLNVKCTEYKSSTDYMSRLVRRLIKYNFPNDEIFKENDTTRVLILKQFIKQFDWFKDIKKFDLKDVQALVKEKYKGKYELIDDDIFIDCNNQNASWGGWQITEGFIDAIAKMQGIIKYKAPFIKMNPKICEMIKCIIIEDKLVDESKLNETKVLSECFKDFYYDVELDWFKTPEEMGLTEELVNVLCRVVKADRLTQLAKKGKAKTLSACFKGGRIPPRENVFKNFNEIEMIPELCQVFYKMLRKRTNEEELRSQKAKDGTAKTLAECFTIDSSNMQINNINSIITCFYKLIYDEMDKAVENCTVNKSTYNDATKKGGDLYEKSRKKLNFYYYELLKIVDDLANAKFSNQGKTREYLYVFAIAFGMTSTGYSEDSIVIDEITGDEKLKEDPRKITDIQKNLFFDYYADNIVNNLDSIAGINKNKSKMSVDGYGINYKNFAEVTFLWCIKQKSLTPKEKLKLAYEIIKYCKKNGKREEDFKKSDINSSEEKMTQIYKEYYNNTGINIKEKSDFQDFLIKNYPCRFNGNVMRVNGSGWSAGKELEEQQDRVKELLRRVEAEMFYAWDPNEDVLKKIIERDNENNDIVRLFILRHYLRELKCKNCKRKKGGTFPNCYAFFEPYTWFDESGEERKISSCEDFCADKKCDAETLRKSLKNTAYIGDDCEEDFERRLTRLSRLCSSKQTKLKKTLQAIENRVNINVLYLEKKDVSRTALVALCYFEMVLMNYMYRSFCENINKTVNIETFEEFYKKFCDGRTVVATIDNYETGEYDKVVEFAYPGANTILERAGYQKINSKNMLDVYVIFLAYRDNYKKLFTLPDASEFIRYAEIVNKKLKIMKKEIEEKRINENNISKDR